MQDKKWLLIMTLALVAIGANFWGFPVYILDEAKNAACAWEMMQRGDWVVPTFNGQLRTDKPPLHYFLMMTSYKIFGVSPFSARLFSVILGLATVAVVYRFTKWMSGARAAFFSGLVLTCSLFFIVEFHLAVPDPYFIFFLTWSWFSFAYAWQSGKGRYYYISYAATALAFMAKGPAALVLSGTIFLVFIVLRSEFRLDVFIKVKALAGLLILLVIAAPWWIAVALKTDGEWVRGFIWEHNVGRFAAAYEDHGNIPGTAILVLFVSLLPLSTYLPQALVNGWTNRKQDSLAFMATVGVLVVALLFSASRTFLANYIGPAVPMAAVLIGIGMDRHLARFKEASLGLKWTFIGLAIAVSPLVPVLQSVISSDRWIGDLSFLAWTFLPISLGAWMAAGFLWTNRLRPALFTWLLSFWLTGVLLFSFGAQRIFENNPVSRSLSLVSETPDEVIGYRFFNAAYVFNLQRTFLTFWDVPTMQNHVSDRPVMILTRDEDRKVLEAAGFRVIFEYPYLFEGSTALVLTNRPE